MNSIRKMPSPFELYVVPKPLVNRSIKGASLLLQRAIAASLSVQLHEPQRVLLRKADGPLPLAQLGTGLIITSRLGGCSEGSNFQKFSLLIKLVHIQ